MISYSWSSLPPIIQYDSFILRLDLVIFLKKYRTHRKRPGNNSLIRTLVKCFVWKFASFMIGDYIHHLLIWSAHCYLYNVAIAAILSREMLPGYQYAINWGHFILHTACHSYQIFCWSVPQLTPVIYSYSTICLTTMKSVIWVTGPGESSMSGGSQLALSS